jgi:hypothetical protein
MKKPVSRRTTTVLANLLASMSMLLYGTTVLEYSWGALSATSYMKLRPFNVNKNLGKQ